MPRQKQREMVVTQLRTWENTMWCAVLVLAFALRVQCAERTVDNSCPHSLQGPEHKTYLQVEGNICYQFVTYNVSSYDDANNICKEDGGFLVMPKSKTLNNYLAKMLRYTYDVTEPTWIGLSDKQDEGNFEWEDGSELGWENFADENGPDNHGFLGLRGKAEDCVAIHSDGLWHDYQCEEDFLSFISDSDVLKNFVCQYPALNLLDNQDDETDVNDEHKGDDDGYNDLLGNKASQQISVGVDDQKEREEIGEGIDIKKDLNDDEEKHEEEPGGETDESYTSQAFKEHDDKLVNNTSDPGGEDCPVFDCDKFCPLGFKTDDFGCLLCECVTHPN